MSGNVAASLGGPADDGGRLLPSANGGCLGGGCCCCGCALLGTLADCNQSAAEGALVGALLEDAEAEEVNGGAEDDAGNEEVDGGSMPDASNNDLPLSSSWSSNAFLYTALLFSNSRVSIEPSDDLNAAILGDATVSFRC